jgi:hypothetical protein
VRKTIHSNGRIVAIIAIRLQVPPEVFQQAFGFLLDTAGIVVIQDNRLIRWPTSLQPQVGLG